MDAPSPEQAGGTIGSPGPRPPGRTPRPVPPAGTPGRAPREPERAVEGVIERAGPGCSPPGPCCRAAAGMLIAGRQMATALPPGRRRRPAASGRRGGSGTPPARNSRRRRSASGLFQTARTQGETSTGLFGGTAASVFLKYTVTLAPLANRGQTARGDFQNERGCSTLPRLQEGEPPAMTLIGPPHPGRACFRLRLPNGTDLRPPGSRHTRLVRCIWKLLSSSAPYRFPMYHLPPKLAIKHANTLGPRFTLEIRS